MKRILITGGNGFVGIHFAKKLFNNNIQLDIVDITKQRHKYCSKYFKKDCRDFFKKNKPNYDLIIHLAAVVGGRVNLEKNQIAVATDLSIDSDFFNWVKDAPKDTSIIYFSSSAAYPIELQKAEYTLKENDIDLQNIKNPDMTYGWVKLTGEMLALQLHQEYKKNITVFRPFSGYGILQDDTYPFPSILERIFKKNNPVDVWGNGLQVRDFININDVIEGSLYLSDKIINGKPINLSTGVATSFKDLIYKAYSIVWNEIPQLKINKEKPTGPSFRCGSIELQKQYGFNYLYSLEDGIIEYINFLKSKGVKNEF